MKNTGPILLSSLLEDITADTEHAKFPAASLDALKRECRETIEVYRRNKDFRIYRGDRNAALPVAYFDPGKYNRVSRNTNNIFTLLVAASPAWSEREIPLRHKSIICITNASAARYYGNTYVVFLVDGARVGVGTERDNWENYKTTSKEVFGVDWVDVDMFNVTLMETLVAVYGIEVGKMIKSSSTAAETVWELLRGADAETAKNKEEMLSRLKRQMYYTEFVRAEKMIEFGGLVKSAATYINPVKNNIVSVDMNALAKMNRGDVEVWTDAPCYFVDINFLADNESRIF